MSATILLVVILWIVALAGVLMIQNRAHGEMLQRESQRNRSEQDALQRRLDSIAMAEAEANRRAAEAQSQIASLVAAQRAREESLPTHDQQLDAYGRVATKAAREQSTQVQEEAERRFEAMEKAARARREEETKALMKQLGDMTARMEQMQKDRSREATEAAAQVASLSAANEELRNQTSSLAGALRDDRVRGNWGELNLRNVMERGGLVRNIHFTEQSSKNQEDARRPDVIVNLPDGKTMVIDAKAPLVGYQEAFTAEDPAEQARHLKRFTTAVRNRVTELAKRDYAADTETLDLVLLYLPGDCFLATALDHDPGLFNFAHDKGILLCAPISLLGLLQGVAMSWREQQVSEQAAEIARLGAELHKRMTKWVEHYSKVGGALDKAVQAFNDSVGTLDSRVIPTGRKLAELAVPAAVALGAPSTVNVVARSSKLNGELAAAATGDDSPDGVIEVADGGDSGTLGLLRSV